MITYAWCLWLVLAFILFVCELHSAGLFFLLAGSIGAIGAALISCVIPSVALQFLSMLGISFCAFLVLYYWLSNVNKHKNLYRSNMQRLLGKRTIIISKMPIGSYIYLDGDHWLVKTLDNQPLCVGECVEVIQIMGCHLVVRKLLVDK